MTSPAARPWLWSGYLALAACACLFGRNFAGAADSSGHLDAERRAPPEFGPPEARRRQQFEPGGFGPFDGHARRSPTVAVGLPLHLGASGLLFGGTAAPAIAGFAGTGDALPLTCLVGRRLAPGRPTAWPFGERLALTLPSALLLPPLFALPRPESTAASGATFLDAPARPVFARSPPPAR